MTSASPVKSKACTGTPTPPTQTAQTQARALWAMCSTMELASCPFSKLHTFVTTCTNHSEYAALAYGAKEAQWMVYLFDALEPQIKHTPVPLFVDNSGVVSMVFNPVDHQSNKHIRISCHYARELTQEQLIAPQRVPTDKNLADIFTKPLGGAAFKRASTPLCSPSRRALASPSGSWVLDSGATCSRKVTQSHFA